VLDYFLKCDYRRDRDGTWMGRKNVPGIILQCFKDLLDNLDSLEVCNCTFVVSFTPVVIQLFKKNV